MSSSTSNDRLLATCWSSAGDAASDRADLRSPLNLRERIEAASAAGFTGFGLLSADLPAAEKEYGLSGIRTLLDDNGMVDLELEGIPYWWDDGPHRAESDRIRRSLLHAAEVRSGHDTSRSTRTAATHRGSSITGPRSSPSWRPSARASAPGWGSSSSRGRTSRTYTPAWSSSRRPGTTTRASSSTCGTSSARTRSTGACT